MWNRIIAFEKHWCGLIARNGVAYLHFMHVHVDHISPRPDMWVENYPHKLTINFYVKYVQYCALLWLDHGWFYSYPSGLLHWSWCDKMQVNSLGPSDAIWRQRSGSPLAQVMSCCLTTPSHYLNQCWLIISKVEQHSCKDKFTRDTSVINHWNYLENEVLEMSFKFQRGQRVK